MKILHLFNNNISDIKYHIDRYTDSQVHLRLEQGWNKFPYNDKNVKIITRINDLNALFILMQAVQILKHEGLNITEIFITYLLCARTERRFSMNEAIDFDIIKQCLKNLNVSNIKVLDPHVEAEEYTAVYEFSKRTFEDKMIVFPDEGAYNRYSQLIENPSNIAGYFIKHRNSDQIDLSFNCINKIDTKTQLIVVDDLCDGGNTFVQVSEWFEKNNYNNSRTLFITHVIQILGLQKISQCYDSIYLTNSFYDWHLTNASNYDCPLHVTIY